MRRFPLTGAQVRRYHWRRFAVAWALLLCVLYALMLAGADALQNGIEAAAVLALGALGALAVYLWRVTRRRWRRISGMQVGRVRSCRPVS